MATKTKTLTEGDLVLHRESAEFCYISSKLTNSDASNALTDFDPIGQPVKASGSDYVFVLSGDEANAEGMVVGPVGKIASLAAAGTTTERYRIIYRGPAVLNQSNFPANDVAGNSLTAATLATAYAGQSPTMISKTEPTVQETGTT